MFLAEDHPLVLNLSFSASLGLLPVILSLKTAGCGIKNTGDQMEAERNSVLLLLFRFINILISKSNTILCKCPSLYQ
jgi:hypothetical protein